MPFIHQHAIHPPLVFVSLLDRHSLLLHCNRHSIFPDTPTLLTSMSKAKALGVIHGSLALRKWDILSYNVNVSPISTKTRATRGATPRKSALNPPPLQIVSAQCKLPEYFFASRPIILARTTSIGWLTTALIAPAVPPAAIVSSMLRDESFPPTRPSRLRNISAMVPKPGKQEG